MGKGSGGSGGSISTMSGGRFNSSTANGLKFTKTQQAISAGDVAVKVSVAKLNAAWAKDAGYYLPSGGNGTQKYQNAREYVSSGKSINMPHISYDRSGTVSFVDGRHRTAALRDSGAKHIYVTVSRGAAGRVARDLG